MPSGILAAGQTIGGRYRLDRLLGEGGMGQVWEATHAVTNRHVALKFVRTAVLANEDVRKRFLREARTATRVQHENVVAVHDLFELDDGTPVMVMDLLVGESLRDKLQREGRLSLDVAVSIMLPVIAAVEAAHAVGVVHRDLKPDNVFLRLKKNETTVQVLDFGIAKLIDLEAPESRPMTEVGSILGTPGYMAPEQLFGERDVDHRADVWAVGIVLFEMLSGRLPFVVDNLGMLIRRLAEQDAPSLSTYVADVPTDVAALVAGLLLRDRSKRTSLSEATRVLRRHRHTRLVVSPLVADARHQIVVRPTTDPSASTVRQDATPPPMAARPRRAWMIAVGLALAFTALAIVLRSRAPAVPTPSAASAPSSIATTSSATSAPAPSPSPAAPVMPSFTTVASVVPSAIAPPTTIETKKAPIVAASSAPAPIVPSMTATAVASSAPSASSEGLIKSAPF